MLQVIFKVKKRLGWPRRSQLIEFEGREEIVECSLKTLVIDPYKTETVVKEEYDVEGLASYIN